MNETAILETRWGRFLIRPYREGDEGAVLEGWKKAFGKEMSFEEWRWKYRECPGGFRCLLCLTEDGKVAVHYAAQVYPATFRGERILGLHLTDTFSVPEYRWAVGGKHGLLVKTGLYFLKTYLENFPAEETFRLRHEVPKAVFHYGFPGERHFRLGALLLHYRRFGPGIAYLRRSPMKITPSTEKDLKGDIELQELRDKESALQDLWTYIESRYSPFMVIRDWAFFGWRYLTSPRRKQYLFFWQEKGLLRKQLRSWAIAALSPQRKGYLSILDFLARTENDLQNLLQTILLRAAEHGLSCETWLSANHPWRRIFLNQGFRPAREPLGIVAAARMDLSGSSPDIADDMLWTLGEADLF